jgi:hypothetical protein
MIVWKRGAALGQPIGWVNVAEGRPGTWAAFGEIGAVKLHSPPTPWNVTIANNTWQVISVPVIGARHGWHSSVGIASLPSGDWQITSRAITDAVHVVVFNRTGASAGPLALTVYADAWPFTP